MKKKFLQEDDITKKIIISEIEKKGRSRVNRIFLGIFLGFCILVLLARITQGILLDMGLHDGSFHIGYWSDGDNYYSFKPEFESWKIAHPEIQKPTFEMYVDEHPSVQAMINQHPFTFWWLTQFTWLTTLIIIMFLTFRFLGLSDRIPKWLKWVMSQKTITHVASWDLLVAGFFWAGLATSFESSFSKDLYISEFITTVCVHGVIPFMIVTYAVIYLLRDRRASLLKEFFAIKGLIFPAIYTGLYLILTIVWYDPYRITNMHETLVNKGWGEWAKELWKIPAILFGIYALLGVLTIFHNVILIHFNNKYDPENDYEAEVRRRRKLEKIRRSIIVKEIKKEMK